MGTHSGPDDMRLVSESLRADRRSDPVKSPAAPLSILLVDDDPDCRNICRTILEHVGFGVQEAADGRIALQMVRQTRPDLIILDLSLPVMDGWEVAHALRNDPKLLHIPIVVLSAHALEITRRMSVEVGCDRYLVKPISPMNLVREVERFLPLPKPASGTRPLRAIVRPG